MENNHRKEKISEILKQIAAEFIQKESNYDSMITITNANVSSDFQKATIFVTVFPEDKEESALSFLRRNLSEFRNFVKKKLSPTTHSLVGF